MIGIEPFTRRCLTTAGSNHLNHPRLLHLLPFRHEALLQLEALAFMASVYDGVKFPLSSFWDVNCSRLLNRLVMSEK